MSRSVSMSAIPSSSSLFKPIALIATRSNSNDHAPSSSSSSKRKRYDDEVNDGTLLQFDDFDDNDNDVPELLSTKLPLPSIASIPMPMMATTPTHEHLHVAKSGRSVSMVSHTKRYRLLSSDDTDDSSSSASDHTTKHLDDVAYSSSSSHHDGHNDNDNDHKSLNHIVVDLVSPTSPLSCLSSSSTISSSSSSSASSSSASAASLVLSMRTRLDRLEVKLERSRATVTSLSDERDQYLNRWMDSETKRRHQHRHDDDEIRRHQRDLERVRETLKECEEDTAVRLAQATETEERLKSRVSELEIELYDARSESKRRKRQIKEQEDVVDQSLKQTMEARRIQSQMETELSHMRAKLQQLEGDADDESYFKRDHLLGLNIDDLPSDRLSSLRSVIETSYDRILEAQSAQYQCRICICAPATLVFLPCKHQVVCAPCYQRLAEDDGPCPVCRSDISDAFTPFN